MEIIDFSNCEIRKKSYEGANGNKICIKYNDEWYMLKFPAASKRNNNLSYLNSCVSEYIGCHIYETFDIPVQKTILGIYKTKAGKEKVVVACKDFTVPNFVLQNFASEKNKLIDSKNNGYGTELSSVLETIETQNDFDVQTLKEHFWDMFIVDALIGNWDRHNGNWGFLYNFAEDTLELAPVFDCGSALYPSADEQIMLKTMSNEDELKLRIYEIPTSALKQNDKRIKYFEFINSLQNQDCNQALKKIYKKLNKEKIKEIIDNTPLITDIQKTFLNFILEKRVDMILSPSYEKLQLKEKSEELLKDKPLSEVYIDFIVNKVIKDRCSVKEANDFIYDSIILSSDKNLKYEEKLRQELKEKNINSNQELKTYLGKKVNKLLSHNKDKDNSIETMER